MNQTKTSKSKLIIFFLLIVIVVTAGLEAGGVIHIFPHHKNQVTPQSGLTVEQTKQQSDVNVENKKQSIEQGANTPAQPTKSIELTAKQENNGTVTIFTKLFGYASGSCTLDISNGNKSTQQVAEVIFQSEYSSCAGFSIPVSSVGSGSWTIKLSVSSEGQNTDKSITFKAQ